jgi:hypothetical protein
MRDDPRQVAEMVTGSQLPGGRQREAVTGFPSRRQVEEALLKLDGAEFTELFLYRYPRSTDAETFLGISGGPGRYFVGISDHAQRIGQLTSTEGPSSDEGSVTIGGVPTSIPRRYLVGLPAATIAATHYLDTGQAAPELDWDWR